MSRQQPSAPAALVRAKLRILRRTLWEDGFVLFVLGPIIVGGFWFILQPTLARAADWIQAASANLVHADFLAAGLALTIALIAAGMPSALRETYAIRTADVTLDALPLGPRLRFGLITITQLVRNIPGFAAVWVAYLLLAEASGGRPPHPAGLLPPMAAVTVLQLLGALVLLRMGLFRTGRLLALAAGMLALAWVVRSVPEAVWVSGPLALPARFFADRIAMALRGGSPVLDFSVIVVVVVARFISVQLYLRWREEDRERAEQALAQKRRLLSGFEQRLSPRLGLPGAALLARDLRLTLRGFVPATSVAVAMAALCLTAGFVGGRELQVAYRDLAAQLGVALACLSLSALAPLMLARQLPMHWIELASGAPAEALWRTKCRLALAISLPALLVGLAAGLALGLEPGDYLAFALRLVLSWVTMATIIGLLSFEIADSPALGLLLGGLFSVGVCGFYAIPNYWPLGVFIYAYIMNALKQRANQTAAKLGAQA